ncbi:MAG: Gfo/Idh/MocA family protein [Planctomycetota bacterium]
MSNDRNPRNVTRRSFVAGAAAAGAAWAVGPRASKGAEGANERLSIGMIGVGSRAGAHLKELCSLSEAENVEITALCDVWQVNLDKAAAAVKKQWGTEPRKFTRFGDLLALPDVDAVVIAPPDFAHGSMLVAALEAGKDVYIEKPMSIDLDLANQALDLARAKDRVVQVGTQRRSDGQFIAAARLVATGVLGQVSRVTAEVNFNQARWARGYKDCKPDDVDWDAYLFNRPKVPFDARLLRQWQLFRLCTNGLPGLWMTHYADAVHMIMGASFPASAVALGGTYVWNDGREHSDTFRTLLNYPEGFLMSWGMGLGNSAGTQFTVHGTQGTLDLEQWVLSPSGGAKGTKVQEQKIAAEQGESHVANWLHCIRSRQRPNADIEYGHQHVVATIMAATALESGRRVAYDREARRLLQS